MGSGSTCSKCGEDVSLTGKGLQPPSAATAHEGLDLTACMCLAVAAAGLGSGSVDGRVNNALCVFVRDSGRARAGNADGVGSAAVGSRGTDAHRKPSVQAGRLLREEWSV